jgi:hypothetical protein
MREELDQYLYFTEEEKIKFIHSLKGLNGVDRRLIVKKVSVTTYDGDFRETIKVWGVFRDDKPYKEPSFHERENWLNSVFYNELKKKLLL